MKFYFKLRPVASGDTAGPRPVLLCARIGGVRKYLTLPVVVRPADWDDTLQTVTLREATGEASKKEIRGRLALFSGRAFAYVTVCEIQGADVTWEGLRAAVLPSAGAVATKKDAVPESSLRTWVYKYLEIMNPSYSLVIRYMTTLKAAETLHPGIKVQDVDFNFLGRFWAFCRKNNNVNTANKKVQNLRTIVAHARKSGIATASNIEFYKLRWNAVQKDFLTMPELLLLENAVATDQLKGPEMNVAAGFLFCCFTGLRWNELALLSTQPNSLRTEGLFLHISKTQTVLQVPISERARALWSSGKVGRVFSNQKCNSYLKLILERLDIRKHLSFHCSRHTFAVLGLEMGIKLEVMQQLMGHANIATTMIYAKVLQASKVAAVALWDTKKPDTL